MLGNVQIRKKYGYYYGKIDNTTFTTVLCKEGSTMIQNTNPIMNNLPSYFDRPKQEYFKGFGYLEKEFWLGLQNMYKSNLYGNNALRIEGSITDGTMFWAEYKDFELANHRIDNQGYFYVTYFPGNGIDKTYYRARDKMEIFPIISLKQHRSSRNGQFIMVLPSIVACPEENQYMPPEYFSYKYQDLNYAGFYTTDAEEVECPLQAGGGWWFTHQEHITNGTVCYWNQSLSSNLNGQFHEQTAYNRRIILFCDGKVEHCLKKNNYSINRNEGGSYATNLTEMKLVTAQMFLYRKIKSSDSLGGFNDNCGKRNYNPMVIILITN